MSRQFDRRTMLRLGTLAGAGALVGAGARAAAAGTMPQLPPDAAADRIVASVRRPRFPGRSFPVTSFGAVGDGVTKNTAAFAAAISACSRSGGGHVVVPPGQFLTGAVHLLNYSPFIYAYGQRNIAVTGAGTLNGQADANHW